MLLAIAARAEAASEELIALEVANVGKLTSEVRREIRGSLEQLRSFATLVREFDSADPSAGETKLFWEPVGVVASIVPWNAPMNVMFRRMAVTVATGTTTVLKPSHVAPLTPLVLAGLAEEAGLPPGVVNVVTGQGSEVGAYLARHPGIAKISFLGSQEVGEQLLREAAARFVPAAVELGGKSPQVVTEDAPWDAAISGVLRGFTRNAGQICSCGTRLIVAELIAPAFVEELVARAGSMLVGPADEPATEMGPLITAEHRTEVDGYVDRARRVGRPVLTGGDLVPGEGFFYRPTIVGDVHSDDEIFQEEVFGPVLTVTTFRDDRDAIRLANATRYGLVAGIWSQDEERALRLANGIDSGACWINGYWNSPSWMSRSAHRRSGFGALDYGVEGLREYLVPKQISIAAQTRPA